MKLLKELHLWKKKISHPKEKENESSVEDVNNNIAGSFELLLYVKVDCATVSDRI